MKMASSAAASNAKFLQVCHWHSCQQPGGLDCTQLIDRLLYTGSKDNMDLHILLPLYIFPIFQPNPPSQQVSHDSLRK